MPLETPRRKPPLFYLIAGKRIASRYEIVEVVGRGGMGLVVKAKDLNLEGELVAVKILYPRFANNPTTLARFRREVLLTRSLSHANIVRIFDLCVTTDTETGETLHYLTMEYVAGESLESKLKTCKPNGLPFLEIQRVVHDVALGLGYAHRNGIVHRDIKPANILLGINGEIKITDFGVARIIDSAEQLTRTNEAIGSPNYMSPEQITAERVDHRTDLYALGIVAFEIATGELPFKSEQWMALVHQHMSEAVPQISTIAPQANIPNWFQQLIESACAKDRSKRFQSGEEIAEAIDINGDIPRPVVQTVATRFPARVGASWASVLVRNNKILVPTAVMLVLALVGAGGFAAVKSLLSTLAP